MKDKFLAYIEKLQPLLEKIKPWLKTKRAWIEIGLCLVAIICLVAAGVSSCSRQNIIDENTEHTEEATERPSVKPTDDLVVTATPMDTEIPVTVTPTAAVTENNDDAQTQEDGFSAPEKSNTATSNAQPEITGAPMYTPLPENNSSVNEAYRNIVSGCSGFNDYSQYYLYDMNSDGTNELILQFGYSEVDRYIDIYSYQNGEIVFLGDVAGSFATVCGCADGGIIVYYRRSGYESIELLEMDNTELLNHSIVPQAKVDEYTVLDNNVDIPTYSIEDLSPLS